MGCTDPDVSREQGYHSQVNMKLRTLRYRLVGVDPGTSSLMLLQDQNCDRPNMFFNVMALSIREKDWKNPHMGKVFLSNTCLTLWKGLFQPKPSIFVASIWTNRDRKPKRSSWWTLQQRVPIRTWVPFSHDSLLQEQPLLLSCYEMGVWRNINDDVRGTTPTQKLWQHNRMIVLEHHLLWWSMNTTTTAMSDRPCRYHQG